MKTLSPARPTGKRESARYPLLEAALKNARRGWRVFPIHTPTGKGCSCKESDCKNIGKHSRIVRWPNAATTDPAIIRGWWTQWPDANIGIATGPESGIFVLDVDGEDGQTSLKLLEAEVPLPKTLRALTGRRGQSGERSGFHLYFNCPVGTNLNNKAGLLGKGLDIRAAGTCVVAPPSVHSSGLRYEWTQEESAIVDAPPWLIAKASKLTHSDRTPRAGLLCQGERNDTLFRRACARRRKGATKDELERFLSAENNLWCRPQLDISDILDIAASAAVCGVGGPDPLEMAWQKVLSENHDSTYSKLLALARHLQLARPGLPIALPQERIGKLMGCDPTLVSRYRRRAVATGMIVEVRKYVIRRVAGTYMVPNPSETGVPLALPTST